MNFVVIGIENQEHTNYLMPLRCLRYDVSEYERQASLEKAKIRRWKKMQGGKASKENGADKGPERATFKRRVFVELLQKKEIAGYFSVSDRSEIGV